MNRQNLRLVAASALLLPSAALHAATFAHVDGTQSVAIGGNLDYRTDTVTATLRLFDEQPNEVRIMAGEYSLTFAAPQNAAALVPENYEIATSRLSRVTLPYMQVDRLGRGCNSLSGRFVVHEFAADAANNISALAMDFSAECFDLGGGEILHGQIRLNSDIAEILPGPTAAAGPDRKVSEQSVIKIHGADSLPGATPIASWTWRQVSGPAVTIYQHDIATTAVQLPDVNPGGARIELELAVTNQAGNSDSDVVALDVADSLDARNQLLIMTSFEDKPFGDENYYTDDLGTFEVNSLQNTNVKLVTVRYDGLASHSFEFHVPYEQMLAAGFYPQAAAAPFHSRKDAALQVDSPCRFSSDSSWFYIRELEFGSGGEITSVAIDFHEFCPDFGIRPLTRGALRINSNVPLIGDTPIAATSTDQIVYAGATVVLNAMPSLARDAVRIWPTERIARYQWTQLDGMPVTLDGMDQAVSAFVAPAVAIEDTLTFRVEVTDTDGHLASDTTRVTVRPTNTPRTALILSSGTNHYVLSGRGFAFNDTNAEFSHNTSVAWRLFNSIGGDDTWYVNFMTTDSSPLVVGSYSGDVISISGAGRACSSNSGSVELLRYDQDASGEVIALEAQFEHYCDGTTADRRSSGSLYVNQVVPGLPPVAEAGNDIHITEGETFTLDATASSDPDGEIVAYRWRQIAGSYHGLNSVGFSRTQPVIADFVARKIGPDVEQEMLTFEMGIADDDGFWSRDSVNVFVTRASPVPVASDDAYSTSRDNPLDLNLLANDVSGAATINNLVVLDAPFFGALSFPGELRVLYTPDPGFVGSDQFSYWIVDEESNYSKPATVSLNVQAPAPPPPSSPPASGGGGGGGAALWLLAIALLGRRRLTGATAAG